MGILDRRLSRLEQESRHRNKKNIILVERYRGQSIEEAKEEAGISSENEHEYQVVFMPTMDYATL